MLLGSVVFVCCRFVECAFVCLCDCLFAFVCLLVRPLARLGVCSFVGLRMCLCFRVMLSFACVC